MSRHLLTCNDPELVVVVGWDESLRTFFAQVEPPGNGLPDELLLWVGTFPYEILDTAELARHVRPWLNLNRRMVARLEYDRAGHR